MRDIAFGLLLIVVDMIDTVREWWREQWRRVRG